MVSKLSALMEVTDVPIKKGDRVLYLGASHGVTAGIISDIVGKDGFVFCLDISPEVMKDLLSFCEKRENTCPLLFDASKPEEYKDRVTKVDVIYQDLAQKNQAEIIKKNARLFLKENGSIILIVKTQSIDTVRSPSQIVEEVKEELKEFNIIVIDLSKTHAKHYAIIGKTR